MERNIGCKHTCCQMTWSFLIRPIKTEIRSNVWKLDILKTSVEAALTFILPWSAPWSRKVPKQVFFSKAGWKEISKWIAHRYAGTSMAVYQHVRMWLNQRSIQHIMGHLLSTVHIEIAFTVHFFYFNQTIIPSLLVIQSMCLGHSENRYGCYCFSFFFSNLVYCQASGFTESVNLIFTLR